MTTPASPVGQPTDQPVLRHLLLSFPSLDIAHNGHDVIDSLVDGAICQLLSTGGVTRIVTLADVSACLHDAADLSYEPAELVASFQRLEARGRLQFRDPGHRAFVYDEAAYRGIADAFRLRMEAWDTVRCQWIDEVRHRHGLEAGQATALWEGLEEFTARLVNGYGAEAAAFLYLSDAAGQTRFYEALSLRLPEVAELVGPELAAIATEEFPRFFDPANASRTDYLTGRLRASFFFHLLSVDPLASALLREGVAEKTLYVDSNFLFRLVGFDGPAAAFLPITAVQVSTQLNCRLVVAQETVDEFVRVVKACVSRLRAVPIRRHDYIRIAANHPSDEGEFMAAFYREYHSGRVNSVEEFGRKWSNIHAHLREWGIEIV